MRFRKKPVVVEARRVPSGPVESMDSAMAWGELMMFLPSKASWCIADDLGVDIDTLEGRMHASPGDWIIRGVKGEYYPCKPDIFEQTYEAVDRQDTIGALTA